MAVGFLHGVLPQGISKSFFVNPERVQILITDEVLFPLSIREELEQELNLKLSVTITRDWEVILANSVASPSADLIFLPSFWANTLNRQNLVSNAPGTSKVLQQRVASDFMKAKTPEDFYFLPFYWAKTNITTFKSDDFSGFLKDTKQTDLFLLADEDLLLRHFQLWKDQGILNQVIQKRILTLQPEQLAKQAQDGAAESVLSKEVKPGTQPLLSALLVWGAIVPANSPKKNLSLKILEALTKASVQEKTLMNTPFNSTFIEVQSNSIPLNRRAHFIRDLQLRDVIILDSKDQEAKNKLKNEFNFIL